jgi:hypothetical protein
MDFAGWRRIDLDLADMPESCAHWGGDGNGNMDYPLTGFAISITEKADEFAGVGTIFVDDLEIAAEAPERR